MSPRLVLGVLALATVPAAGALPWEIEPPLREAAKSVVITGPLAPTDPQPSRDADPRGPAFQISNPAIRSTLWGPADRITLSLLKNDVWDRRVAPVKFTSPTLAEIVAGANAPVNKNATDIRPGADSTRPTWGYLRPEGGRFNPYQDGPRYPFPTAKPTGQIILGIEALKGAAQPELAQNCADGVVRFPVKKGAAAADLEFALSMTRNVYALRGTWTGDATTAFLRLYRHRDTAHYRYMTPDGRAFKDGPQKALYEADKDWNGPLDSPTSGRDGRYFWIRQKLPPEKTFPQGSEYVLMGVVATAGDVKIATVENQVGLGTPGPNRDIREAPGAAATGEFSLKSGDKFTAYVVTVTNIDVDGGDIMAEAKKRLRQAEGDGFEAIVAGNARWYADLYDRRESGRIFVGTPARNAVTEDLKETFASWYCLHDGATQTDMRKYQASAHYVVPEKDVGEYGSLPCYNEVFYTPDAVRNRTDATLMWKQLVEHWMPAARQNAHDVYGMPGMYLTHGFLPPIKPDKYVHTNVALELAVDTQAQVLKTLWDEWDYGGDPKVLAEIYPAMRDMAIFYAAYAKKGADGVYHIIPSMQEESWGIQPGFSHSRDTIAAITMFRWALTRAAEAAKELGRDADSARNWLEVASHLPPYPTWEKPEGLIFAGMPGVEPWRGKGEHPWDIGTYPTVLADDVNLDSDPETRATMRRTAQVLPAGLSDRAQILLGVEPTTTHARRHEMRAEIDRYTREPERLLNSRSGRIHLFPALPPKAGPVAFRDFQARGGFLVSACRDGSKVTFLEIRARRDASCQLMNPWAGRRVAIRAAGKEVSFKTDLANGECLVFDAQAGKTYDVVPL